LRHHGLDLSEPEREFLQILCGIGYLAPEDILELPDEVRFSEFHCEEVDREALAARLESASFADLVAVAESLGV
jgi:hypothetical protein